MIPYSFIQLFFFRRNKNFQLIVIVKRETKKISIGKSKSNK